MTISLPALRLHHYLSSFHWKDGALVGPDPGIRLNYRVFRFAKSYLRRFDWQDDLYYLQAQGYWVLANGMLFDQTQENHYLQIAVTCCDTMLARQQPDGAWPYPNPEWRGRVATAEGVWAALGLLDAYRRTGEDQFLDGALKWHRFMIDMIGFQRDGAQLAVNYFASTRLERIPNNSVFVMRFLAELAEALGDPSYLEPCEGMLEFLSAVQLPSGELPYAVPGSKGGNSVPHFQCYQYNAFQCLDLMRYYALTRDERVLTMIRALLGFLKTGIRSDGHAAYSCDEPERTVTYHTAVTAAAFEKANQMQLGNYHDLATRTYDYVLWQQRADGSFPHSRGDYHILRDQRSYPRYLAMILFHLLHRFVPESAPHTEKERAPSAR